MPRSSKPKRGEDVVRSLFGAILSGQGRGFYVGLELMALLRGTLEHDGLVLPAPTKEPLTVQLRSHDFARRLMGEPRHLADEETQGIEGELALDAIAALGRGLRVPVPGRRRRPGWHGEHFQPFVGELIHYDAVFRKRQKGAVMKVDGHDVVVSVERYLYRGAGGLAHAMLRTDLDQGRLDRTRTELTRLVSDSGTPLGELFASLSARDKGSDEPQRLKTFRDDPEFESVESFDRESAWVEHLRGGVLRIAERKLPRAKIAEAIMYWVPYCIARYQADVAYRELGMTPRPIPVDMGSTASPIRRRSREVHERSRSTIVQALESRAEGIASDVLKSGSRKWRDGARNFYSGTLAAVGALNAHTGKRHFVLGNELLEAIVLAQLSKETPFDSFCRDVLYERLDLVVDRTASTQCLDLGNLNRSDFDSNAEMLAGRLEMLGMLIKYSDHTKMVSAQVAR